MPAYCPGSPAGRMGFSHRPVCAKRLMIKHKFSSTVWPFRNWRVWAETIGLRCLHGPIHFHVARQADDEDGFQRDANLVASSSEGKKRVVPQEIRSFSSDLFYSRDGRFLQHYVVRLSLTGVVSIERKNRNLSGFL